MKIVSKILPAFIMLILALPLFTFAQVGNFGEASRFLDGFIRFINTTLIPLAFAVAFLIFIYGVFKAFVLGGDDEDKQKEGRSLMLYSVIAFVVILSFYGIINLFVDSFGLGDTGVPVPQVPGVRSPGG